MRKGKQYGSETHRGYRAFRFPFLGSHKWGLYVKT